MLGLFLLWAGNVSVQAAAWGSIHGNNRSAETRRGRPAAPAPPSVGHAPPVRREVEPERHFEGRRETEAHRDVIRDRDFGAHRHLDFDGDRRRSFFWFGWNPGMVIQTLPPDYSQIYVGGAPYYYDQGVYYQSAPSGYMVVTPPIGANVAQLPPGAEALTVGSITYYYAAGAFYVQQPQGFVVVAPPLGVTVTEVPPGATPVTLNGTLYYQVNGAYFLPMIQDGVTVYMTVRP